MNALLAFERLYHRLDASLGRVLPEHVRLWLKGMIVATARGLLPSKLGRSDGMPSMLPAWAYAAVSEASIDEPELSPRLLVPYLRQIPISTGNVLLAMGYDRLWGRIDKHVQHVFVLGDTHGHIPDSLVEAIRKLATRRNGGVLVIWTGPSAPPPEGLLDSVQLLDLKQVSGVYRTMEQAVVLGRALIELKPATIHIASSDAAWAMFRIVAAALAERSRLYAEISSIDLRATENRVSEADRSIAFGVPSMVKLIASSKQTVEELVARYGLDRAAIRLGSEDVGSAGGNVDLDWLSNFPGYVE